MIPRCFALMALMAALAATSAIAADHTHVVKFAHGKSSATMAGTVKDYDTATYVLDANEGQAMSILFDPDDEGCGFYVYEPGKGEPVFAAEGNEYSANLPVSGKYSVRIGFSRNDARQGAVCKYSITFEIS